MNEMSVETDKELQILGQIVRLMEQLTPEEQERTTGYLIDRYPVRPLSQPEVLQPGDEYYRCLNGVILFRLRSGFRIRCASPEAG